MCFQENQSDNPNNNKTPNSNISHKRGRIILAGWLHRPSQSTEPSLPQLPSGLGAAGSSKTKMVHVPRLLQSLGWGKNTFCLLQAPRIIKVWGGRDLQISSNPSPARSRDISTQLRLHGQQDRWALASRGSQDSSSYHGLGAIAGEQKEDLASQTHAGWEQRAPRKLLCLCPLYFCSSPSPGAARKDMNSSFSTLWPGFECLQLLPARQKGRK